MVVTKKIRFERRGDADVVDVTEDAERTVATSGLQNGGRVVCHT